MRGGGRKPRMTPYLCQELGPGTKHTELTAGNSQRLGSLRHRAGLKPSTVTAAPESLGGSGDSGPVQQF